MNLSISLDRRDTPKVRLNTQEPDRPFVVIEFGNNGVTIFTPDYGLDGIAFLRAFADQLETGIEQLRRLSPSAASVES